MNRKLTAEAGVTSQFITPSKSPMQNLPESRATTFSGLEWFRGSAEKGAQDLIAAIPKIVAGVPDVQFTIVGDGSERDALQTQAESLGVADRIHWVGRVAKDQVHRYLATMDVVVVPSHFEGFGLSAAEAMAMGKAVVASNVDGLREVVSKRDCWLLRKIRHSWPPLSSDCGRMLNCANGSGAAGKARVQEHFSMDIFRRKHLQLYATMCGTSDFTLSVSLPAKEVTPCS